MKLGRAWLVAAADGFPCGINLFIVRVISGTTSRSEHCFSKRTLLFTVIFTTRLSIHNGHDTIPRFVFSGDLSLQFCRLCCVAFQLLSLYTYDIVQITNYVAILLLPPWSCDVCLRSHWQLDPKFYHSVNYPCPASSILITHIHRCYIHRCYFILLPYHGRPRGRTTHSWLGWKRCSELAFRPWLSAVREPNKRSATILAFLTDLLS